MTRAFDTLPLNAELLKGLEVLEYKTMTPVQEHSLPVLLDGKDVIGQARTGSGKTAAFGLALLAQTTIDPARTQSLVLCPTRELADQVSEEIRRLGRFLHNLKVVTLCGGVPVRTQWTTLQRDPHVIVGTPGRILDHLDRGNLRLQKLKVFVLDEADRMLDMGFAEAITQVASFLPKKRQTLLFSATFPDDIRKMSESFQRDPVEVTVDTAPVRGEITEVFYEVAPEQKRDAVAALLDEHSPESTLIFCRTRNDTRDLANHLDRQGYSVLALHGEMEQRERDEVLLRFSNKSCSILVATDVAARGLDVDNLSAVISFDLSTDLDVHQHRIGRTGRAGKKGIALALCTPKQRGRVARLEEHTGRRAMWSKVQPRSSSKRPAPASMVTLLVDAGKQQKMRAGDLLGALTGDVGLTAAAVGKIDIQKHRTYVAIRRDDAARALDGLNNNKIKGRSFRVRRVED